MAHHIFSQAYFMTSIRPLLDDVLCLARRTNVVAWRRGAARVLLFRQARTRVDSW